MPAKFVKRVDREGSFLHIFNRGISGKAIFIDSHDYEIFLDYLGNYLSPVSQEANKKKFTVNGRTFQGVPHQPKNYFNRINLIAYTLAPNHFHLLLRQLSRGSLESFMKSLCTRYSMYFNKKYQSTGPLFEGPFKSVVVETPDALLQLTRYFHRHQSFYSSFPEYLGKKETSWLKSGPVLSYFTKSENKIFKGVGGYKNFVEKYKPEQNDKDSLEGIVLEREFEPLARSQPNLEGSIPQPQEKKTKLFGFALAVGIFALLFTLGLRNVLEAQPKKVISVSTVSSPSPIPSVAGLETEAEKNKTILLIKIPDKSSSINIRQNPDINSEKVGEAKDGDIFEFVSINSGWFGVKLADGSIGFILSKYIEIINGTN